MNEFKNQQELEVQELEQQENEQAEQVQQEDQEQLVEQNENLSFLKNHGEFDIYLTESNKMNFWGAGRNQEILLW